MIDQLKKYILLYEFYDAKCGVFMTLQYTEIPIRIWHIFRISWNRNQIYYKIVLNPELELNWMKINNLKRMKYLEISLFQRIFWLVCKQINNSKIIIILWSGHETASIFIKNIILQWIGEITFWILSFLFVFLTLVCDSFLVFVDLYKKRLQNNKMYRKCG